jgi:hypothetical protein
MIFIRLRSASKISEMPIKTNCDSNNNKIENINPILKTNQVILLPTPQIRRYPYQPDQSINGDLW